VVTPNIVIPTVGRSSTSTSGSFVTMPTTARAALEMTVRDSWLSPSMSATEYSIITSRDST
jgi:hypothetical protein